MRKHFPDEVLEELKNITFYFIEYLKRFNDFFLLVGGSRFVCKREASTVIRQHKFTSSYFLYN